MHSAIASICRLLFYKVPYSLPIFVNMCIVDKGKVGMFSTSQGKVRGILIHEWGLNRVEVFNVHLVTVFRKR